MLRRFCIAPGLRGRAWALAVAASALGLGCRSEGPAGSGAGFRLEPQPPGAWRPAPPAAFTVPGTALAAWTGPNGSALVVYRTLPISGGSAASLAEETANRLTHLPGLEVVARRAEALGGQEAVRVEIVAPGTGGAIAPSGTGTPADPRGRALVPTRAVLVGLPRPGETLWLAWSYPEAVRQELAPHVEATLRRLGPASRGSSSLRSRLHPDRLEVAQQPAR